MQVFKSGFMLKIERFKIQAELFYNVVNCIAKKIL